MCARWVMTLAAFEAITLQGAELAKNSLLVVAFAGEGGGILRLQGAEGTPKIPQL